MRCQLFSSAGHVHPIIIVSRSSCLLEYVSLSLLQDIHAAAMPLYLPITAQSLQIHQRHQFISHQRHRHQCLDSTGGFIQLLLGADTSTIKSISLQSPSTKGFWLISPIISLINNYLSFINKWPKTQYTDFKTYYHEMFAKIYLAKNINCY